MSKETRQKMAEGTKGRNIKKDSYSNTCKGDQQVAGGS